MVRNPTAGRNITAGDFNRDRGNYRLLAVVLLGLHLVHDLLLATVCLQHGSLDGGTLHVRLTNLQVVTLLNGEHTLKVHLGAGLKAQAVARVKTTSRDQLLTATDLDDSIECRIHCK